MRLKLVAAVAAAPSRCCAFCVCLCEPDWITGVFSQTCFQTAYFCLTNSSLNSSLSNYERVASKRAKEKGIERETGTGWRFSSSVGRGRGGSRRRGGAVSCASVLQASGWIVLRDCARLYLLSVVGGKNFARKGWGGEWEEPLVAHRASFSRLKLIQIRAARLRRRREKWRNGEMEKWRNGETEK